MASLKKDPSPATMALARKAPGKLPKRPKKPKMNASESSLEGYVVRHNAWVDKVHALAKSTTRKATLKKQIFGHA